MQGDSSDQWCWDNCPRDDCPRDSCPSEFSPRRLLSKETVVQGRLLSKEDYCPRTHLSKETILSLDKSPLEKGLLEQKSPRANVSLNNRPLDICRNIRPGLRPRVCQNQNEFVEFQHLLKKRITYCCYSVQQTN